MPESRGRKKRPESNAQRKAAERRANRKPFMPDPPTEHVIHDKAEKPPVKGRAIVREIPAAERYKIPTLPDAADYTAVLVALSEMDPLAQEVMIAERIAALPSQKDGSMPVNIPRMVRPAWAHQLRKLGIFVIPELATHELVAPDGTGMMINHTAGEMRKVDRGDLWEKAKAQNPELAQLVDNAKTPEEKRAAMRVIASQLPVQTQVALDRLINTSPEELEPF